MSCGYQGHEFGAPYLDSLCIDGYLWDADSGSAEEGFSSGGDTPCPSCNTSARLEQIVEDIQESIDPETNQPEIFENQIRHLLGIAPTAGLDAAAALPRHVFLHIGPSLDTAEILEHRTWPWAIPGLSAHQNLTLMRASRNPPGKDLSTAL